MKRTGIVAFSIFVALSICASTVPAQDVAAVKKELEAQYRKQAEAHEKEDLAAILAFRTENFHSIFPDGKIGDARTMEEYSRRFLEGNEPPYNIRFTIDSLTVSENELIAVCEVFQEVSRYRDMEGKRRKVDTNVHQREIWWKTTDGWKIKSVDNVRDHKRFVDGKRVDPSKPYDPNAPEYDPDGK